MENTYIVCITLTAKSTNTKEELESFYKELMSDYQGTEYTSSAIKIDIINQSEFLNPDKK